MPFKWKKNHGCEQPRLLCFVDTEANQIQDDSFPKLTRLFFRLGVARFGRWDGSTFNGVQTVRFTNVAEFWRVLGEHCRPKMVQWVFAHNILFDSWLLGLPEAIDRGLFKLSEYPKDRRSGSTLRNGKDKAFIGQCSIDKGCTIIKGVLSGRRVNLVDTYNYFRGTVDSIGDSIGIPKLPMPRYEDDNETWFQYCENDVKVIETATTGLLREWKANDLGNWQPTIPSLAYSSYRHRFMSRPIVCHGDLDVSQLESDSYFDGRTEAFYSGDIGNGYSIFPAEGSGTAQRGRQRIDGPVYHVDVNSLYPSEMLGRDYPVEAVADSSGKPIIWNPPSLEWLNDQIATYLCVAICKIDTPFPFYPIRNGNRTEYPVGKIWATLCTPEVKFALDNGHLRSVMGVVLYHKWPIFSEWVKYWWKRKRDADAAGNLVRKEVCKILLNGLAGKLAQRNRFWRNSNRFPCEKPWAAWVGFIPGSSTPVPIRSIGRQVQTLNYDGWAAHALIAASAHVNSYSRMRMLADMRSLPPKSVLYCANDALILTQTGYDTLCGFGIVDTGELGHYRTIGTYQNAKIYGPRDYEVDGETVKAGLPKDRQLIGHRKWRVNVFESHNAMIARPPDGSVHIYEETVSGVNHHWGQHDRGDGWLRPNLVDMWSRM